MTTVVSVREALMHGVHALQLIHVHCIHGGRVQMHVGYNHFECTYTQLNFCVEQQLLYFVKMSPQDVFKTIQS